MRGVLLAVEQGRVEPAAADHLALDRVVGRGQEPVGRRDGGRGVVEEIGPGRPGLGQLRRHQPSIASSSVRMPGRLACTSTAMFPGLCWFFHIFMCARGMSDQANTSLMHGST